MIIWNIPSLRDNNIETTMKKLKELVNLIVGFLILLFFIIFKKQGSGKFYIKAQDNKLLNNFLKSKILGQLFKNFRYLEKNIDKEISENSIIYKNDPSLRKYGDSDCGQTEDVNIEKSDLSKREWNELMEAFNLKDRMI